MPAPSPRRCVAWSVRRQSAARPPRDRDVKVRHYTKVLRREGLLVSDSSIKVHGGRATNGEAIRGAAELGYVEGNVLDLTYGKGRFWTDHRPDDLTTNDTNPEARRRVPARLDGHGAVCRGVALVGVARPLVFDPPYKLNGTGGSHASDDGYGVAGASTPAERWCAMVRGVDTAAALSSRWLLVKCQDRVVSGHKFWQTDRLTAHLDEQGWRKVDQLLVEVHAATVRAAARFTPAKTSRRSSCSVQHERANCIDWGTYSETSEVGPCHARTESHATSGTIREILHSRQPPEECWPWTGGTAGKGYGQFYRAKRQPVGAHRFAWELANGRAILRAS